MGHSTLKMTRHYCNIFNDDIIEKHGRVDVLVNNAPPGIG